MRSRASTKTPTGNRSSRGGVMSSTKRQPLELRIADNRRSVSTRDGKDYSKERGFRDASKQCLLSYGVTGRRSWRWR
jgi:hypothetical protein